MADPTDSVELALAELENEPLPNRTREHTGRDPDEIEIAHAEDEDGGSGSAPASEQTRETREIPAEQGIEALRARLQASERATQEANQRASVAEQARTQATGAADAANVQILETALGGLRQGIGILKSQLAEAYAVQDFSAVADLQVEISRQTQREGQIESGLEQLKAQPREQPRAAPPPAPSADQQVEAVASQLSPNAAAWVRGHPQYVTDTRLNAKLMSAHYAAAGEGLALDSPEYIAHVERTLGLGGQPAATPRPGFVEERQPVAESRSRAPPAAPPSRANGGSSPTRVTLTREQREAARDLFPDELQEDPTGRKSEQAYARNMLILKREGRLN
jgi:hypothetical protein